MRNTNFIICFVLSVSSLTCSIKLPTYIKACSISDLNLNDCALEAARSAYSSVVKGDKTFKILSHAPLKLEQVIINVGDSLEMKLFNLTIFGIDNGEVDKVNINLTNKQWTLQFTTKEMIMDLKYDIKGRILLLPIVGEGPGNLTLFNPTFTYNFKYEISDRKDNQYINIISSQLKYKPTKMSFYLQNLFNGDQRLGDVMNSFLNDNWFEVNEEIGPSIGETMNSVVTSVFRNYFGRIPLQNLFTK